MKTKIFFILLFSCVSLAAFTQTNADLKRVQNEIKKQQTQLQQLENSRASTVKQIEAIEKKQQLERQALNLLNREVTENNKQLQKLRSEETLLGAKRMQYEHLAKSGIIFLTDNADSLTAKSILGGADSSEFIAVGELTGKLNETLSEQINEYVKATMQLQEVQAEITLRNAELAKLKKESEVTLASYNASQKTLNTKLSALKNDENAKKDYIKKLEAEQNAITKALKTNSKKNIGTGAFAKLKGKLPYPLLGTVIEPYGEKLIAEANVKIMHKGIKIKPHRGETVSSVADGIVVFVNNINGMQNIVIVQHDNDYYTVYGNLEEFYVTTDNRVAAGEEVGKINKTLQGGDFLYFEIRNHEKALNPADWLKK